MHNFHSKVGTAQLKSLPKLWVMTCQCRFVTEVPLGQGSEDAGGCACLEWGACEKSVELPLRVSVNLKLL